MKLCQTTDLRIDGKRATSKELIKKVDVFFEPDYGRLYEKQEVEPCEVFNFSCEYGSMRNVFIKREIPIAVNENKKHFDIITPYGYGGPIVLNASNTEALLSAYYIAFSDYCKENNIVSEFVRFHLFDNTEVRETYYGETVEISQNVVRELKTPIDELWRCFDHKVRKNVNRAVNAGLEIKVDLIGEHLSDFLKIYYETMERNNASEYYYFDSSYFEAINATLQGKFAYFHVMLEDKIISTELILFGNKYAYSFLGGTLQEFYSYRPNDFLKFEIIKWCQEQGFENFILGGGYHPNDGIYKYKKFFAKNCDIPFYVGKKIHNKEMYENLVDTRSQEDEFDKDTSFFPAYRA